MLQSTVTADDSELIKSLQEKAKTLDKALNIEVFINGEWKTWYSTTIPGRTPLRVPGYNFTVVLPGDVIFGGSIDDLGGKFSIGVDPTNFSLMLTYKKWLVTRRCTVIPYADWIDWYV